MATDRPSRAAPRSNIKEPPGVARWFPPLPLFALQPVLGHIVGSVARRHPELFARLGDSATKRFLIDPQNLPFFLLLQPDPEQPILRAHHRGEQVEHDVRICGTFVTLLRIIDGQSDGDSLFFNRDLTITGDTEAVVALRNALDDVDTSLADDVASAFGPLSGPIRAFVKFTTKPSDIG